MNQPEVHVSATTKFNFSGYSMCLRVDGITEINFDKGFYGELSDAKNIVTHIQKLNPISKALVLAVYEEDNMFSKEVRDYIAGDEVSEFVKADAFVLNGLALRLFGNLYLKINKPKRPGKIFNDKKEAIRWLLAIP
jgi:hypothetical protein